MTDFDKELRSLAGAGSENEFSIRRGERTLRVTHSTDQDGGVTGLTIAVPYDQVARLQARGYRDAGHLVGTRPLEIHLRREHPADAVANAKGLSMEWQSGDSAFDDWVYVSAPTTDPALLSAVIGPSVRRAVIELLDLGFSSVDIDTKAGLVEATMGWRGFGLAGTDRVPRSLAAFERVLDGLPALRHDGSVRPRVPPRVDRHRSSRLVPI